MTEDNPQAAGAPELVIAVYRPKAGQEAALRALALAHWPLLRRVGLVSDRAPIVMQAQDGAIVDIFEWTSAKAAEAAHHQPEVAAHWEAMSEVADFANLASLAEAQATFPHFRSLS
jgi:hypothetical protein